MANDAEDLLREAEDEIEAWLCELDVTWQAVLDDADQEASRRLAEAEADADAVLAEAHLKAESVLADARSGAEGTTRQARADAEDIVALARLEAERIVAEANDTAGEHADVIQALTTAEREAAGEELAALREAVSRLRTELSRLVDAAFDAFPAVEATAEAIDRALDDGAAPDEPEARPEPERVLVGAGAPAPLTPRRGLLRRLLGLH